MTGFHDWEARCERSYGRLHWLIKDERARYPEVRWLFPIEIAFPHFPGWVLGSEPMKVPIRLPDSGGGETAKARLQEQWQA